MNEFKFAKENLYKCLFLEPLYFEANQLMGDIFFNEDDFESSSIYYTKAYKINPQNTLTVKGLLSSLYKLKKFRKALRFAKDLNFKDFKDPVIYIVLFKSVLGYHKKSNEEIDIEPHSPAMIQCLHYLDLAREYSLGDLQLQKEIAFNYYSIHCYQNV